jgi:hypothetical protein
VGLLPAGGLGLSGRVALATAPAAEVVASLSGWLPALETSMAGCNLAPSGLRNAAEFNQRTAIVPAGSGDRSGPRRHRHGRGY